jgi:dTDP-4-dehydrorhamnose 3,5-epimerase-like enzyme
MLLEIFTPDFVNKDERGMFAQLVHSGYSQVNVLSTAAGSRRGGHYHKENTEVFFVVSGKLKLLLSKDTVQEEYIFGEGEMFGIPPYAAHQFYFECDTVLVSMYDKGVEKPDGEKDIFSDTKDAK